MVGEMKFPENDVMIYGDLTFDSFDELLDFSVDEEEEEAAAQLFLSEPLPCPSWDDTLLHRPPPPPPPPQHPDHGPLPCDDIDVAQLEWLSQFVEESFSPAPAPAVELPLKRQYRTPSPVSVLQHPAGYLSPASSCSPTSSSCSGTRPALLPEPAARGPRTKRARPSAPPLPFSAAGDETCVPAPEEDRGEAAERSRKKAKKPRPPGAEVPAAAAAEEPGGGRRCMHCDVQKTPQWRAGPMGPKTLCNACGVRYKSGRLFPEYRPAASPTFSVSLHSNSHKKVVEMRNKSGTGADEEGPARPIALKGCELLNYIRTPGGATAGSGRA